MRMRKLISLLIVFCFISVLTSFAVSEEHIVQISEILNIDEPSGMAYLSSSGFYCDLFPMDNELGTHDKGTEFYWAIWNILGNTPLYPTQLIDTVDSSSIRYCFPSKENRTGAFQIEYDENYLLAEMYNGWNLLYITIHNSDEVTDLGWHIILNEVDLDVLNAVSCIWEDKLE